MLILFNNFTLVVEIDLNEVMAEYHRLDEEDKKVTEELNKYLEELGLPKF